uniref:Uncharacterized protein n=1 Tax=Anguilla anguilla TaxID=7936 RepID=A0A0E9T5T6_ANGAN
MSSRVPFKHLSSAVLWNPVTGQWCFSSWLVETRSYASTKTFNSSCKPRKHLSGIPHQIDF